VKSRVIKWTKKNKISARPPVAASARIAPKICQGQLQTIDSEFHKFHPNLFTSGGVIAERVSIVQTRRKVFAILGEASASSPSNKYVEFSIPGRPGIGEFSAVNTVVFWMFKYLYAEMKYSTSASVKTDASRRMVSRSQNYFRLTVNRVRG